MKSKKKQPIKFRRKMPKNMGICFWPSKLHSTIKDAIAWYLKEFGVRPMYVVAESSDVNLVQVVSMWHEDVVPILHV